MSRAPLRGIRVLDLTQVAVGPYTTLLLAKMGAEVIKVESTRRADPARGPVHPRPHQHHLYPGREPGAEPWNRQGPYLQRNRNKLGMTLDLTTDGGRTLFQRLVQLSDVVVENFRASVMEQWGLGHEPLQKLSPGLIYLKLTAQGATGPERNYGSLGYTMECLGGLASITGYLDGAPLMSNETYPDPVAGILAVGAVLAALRRRRQTGAGALIDLSQREVTTCLIGDAVLDYSLNGRVQGPIGNRHPASAPHGVFPCRGEDNWVAIEVSDDHQWAGLLRALGDPPWAADPRFHDAASRWRYQDEIEPYLIQFTLEHDAYDVMHLLQAHGVPAAPVLKGRQAPRDPHLEARHWWDRAPMPSVEQVYSYIGLPWRMHGSEPAPTTPAPRLGQHNPTVYCALLGLTQAELADLEARDIAGLVPHWE